MKRISWTVVALIVTLAGLSTARPYRGPNRYRVRYSTKAFGLDQPGLISGYAQYSPHAFGVDSQGFVPTWYRYTPYAYGLKSDGLIPRHIGYCGHGPVTSPKNSCTPQKAAESQGQTSQSNFSTAVYLPPVTPELNRTAYWTTSYKQDTLAKVRNHLKNTLPGEYQITRICRIDRDLVTFDVLLPQYNLAIKIWNPQLMDHLKQQEDHRYRRIENYLKRWIEFKIQWEANGDNICHIASNDTDHILSELKNAIAQAQTQS